jgi:hypothetical protein
VLEGKTWVVSKTPNPTCLFRQVATILVENSGRFAYNPGLGPCAGKDVQYLFYLTSTVRIKVRTFTPYNAIFSARREYLLRPAEGEVT